MHEFEVNRLFRLQLLISTWITFHREHVLHQSLLNEHSLAWREKERNRREENHRFPGVLRRAFGEERRAVQQWMQNVRKFCDRNKMENSFTEL